jgi:hypothetical protein
MFRSPVHNNCVYNSSSLVALKKELKSLASAFQNFNSAPLFHYLSSIPHAGNIVLESLLSSHKFIISEESLCPLYEVLTYAASSSNEDAGVIHLITKYLHYKGQVI